MRYDVDSDKHNHTEIVGSVRVRKVKVIVT